MGEFCVLGPYAVLNGTAPCRREEGNGTHTRLLWGSPKPSVAWSFIRLTLKCKQLVCTESKRKSLKRENEHAMEQARSEREERRDIRRVCQG